MFHEVIKHMGLKPGMKLLNVWSRTGGAIHYIKKRLKGISVTNLELSGEFVKKFDN